MDTRELIENLRDNRYKIIDGVLEELVVNSKRFIIPENVKSISSYSITALRECEIVVPMDIMSISSYAVSNTKVTLVFQSEESFIAYMAEDNKCRCRLEYSITLETYKAVARNIVSYLKDAEIDDMQWVVSIIKARHRYEGIPRMDSKYSTELKEFIEKEFEYSKDIQSELIYVMKELKII